ncbi:MAG: hypothetical protein ACRD4Y_03225, partial [Candidatus Acidiferrales bacterium]
HAPVEIANLQAGERPAAERTVIEDVGDFGCRFSLRGPVQPGDVLALTLLARDGTSPLDLPVKIFEVIWVEQGAEKWSVGARAYEGERLARS